MGRGPDILMSAQTANDMPYIDQLRQLFKQGVHEWGYYDWELIKEIKNLSALQRLGKKLERMVYGRS